MQVCSNPILPYDPLSVHITTGYDVRETRTAASGVDYQTTTIADIIAELPSPVKMEKTKAPWAIFSDYHKYDARDADVQAAKGGFPAVVLDIDEGNVSFEVLVDAVANVVTPGSFYFVYSTKSAKLPYKPKQERPRGEEGKAFSGKTWRVVLPTNRLMSYPERRATTQKLINALAEADVPVGGESLRSNQLWFLPNKGAWYEQGVFGNPGQYLDVISPVAEPSLLEQSATALTALVMAHSTKPGGGVIESFNDAHDLGALLLAHDYTTDGKGYMSPLQTTGSYATQIQKDGRRWISLSQSDKDAGLGRASADGQSCCGDAFDIYKYFVHGNDHNAALQGAIALLGLDNHLTPGAGVSKKGLKATLGNFKNLMEQQGVSIRYNAMSKSREVIVPDVFALQDNYDNVMSSHITSICVNAGMSTTHVTAYIGTVADGFPYHPIEKWIRSAPWDGIPRWQAFTDTVQSHQSNKETLMRRWCLFALAGVFDPNGVNGAGVLVLQGATNIGKTTWFKRLVPAQFKAVAEGVMLNPEDKDSVKHAISHWISELGEIEVTFKRADQEALKGFLTKDTDTLRLPYDRMASTFSRRTVFGGSVNSAEFLRDPTGNRRFWVIACTKVNWNHGLDMQQVWAELYETLYLKGERGNLTEEEFVELTETNRAFDAVSDFEGEVLASKFDFNAPEDKWRWLSVTDMVNEMHIDTNSREKGRYKTALLKLNGGARKHLHGGWPVVFVPPLKGSPVSF